MVPDTCLSETVFRRARGYIEFEPADNGDVQASRAEQGLRETVISL